MILAVTGHRPDKIRVGNRNAYDTSVYRGLVEFATRCLEREAPELVITGMAQGWDQAVAEACVDTGLPFVAAIPCNGQDARWPAKAKRHYRWLRGQAREQRVVSPGPYEPWKMMARNKWMVREADKLMALWEGSAGGTADTVARAYDVELPVVNVWNEWLAFTGGAR